MSADINQSGFVEWYVPEVAHSHTPFHTSTHPGDPGYGLEEDNASDPLGLRLRLIGGIASGLKV